MGRIDYNQKRVYRVIDTLARLEKKHPDWKFYNSWRWHRTQEWRVRWLDHDFETRVIWKASSNLSLYYERASILLTSEYEGFLFGFLVECMSFGVIRGI